jgi:hypothetical protein
MIKKMEITAFIVDGDMPKIDHDVVAHGILGLKRFDLKLSIVAGAFVAKRGSLKAKARQRSRRQSVKEQHFSWSKKRHTRMLRG